MDVNMDMGMEDLVIISIQDLIISGPNIVLVDFQNTLIMSTTCIAMQPQISVHPEIIAMKRRKYSIANL